MKIFFYILNSSDITIGEGYASEYLNSERGLIKKYGEQITISNLDNGKENIGYVDLVVVEDDIEDMNKIIDAAIKSKSFECLGLCYDHKVLEKMVDLINVGPKVMTLDILLNEIAGVERKSHIHDTTLTVLKKIQSFPSWNDTVILGLSNYARNELSEEIEKVLNRKRERLYKKNPFIYRVLDDILAASVNEYENNKNIQSQLKLKNSVSGFVIHMEKEKGFRGIGNALEDIWGYIEPFYLWKEGKYDKFQESLRPEFSSAFQLVGETGTGKSSIVREIENWMNAEVIEFNLRDMEDLVTTKKPGNWKNKLEKFVKEKVYRESTSNTTDRKVRIVRCDDFHFQAITQIADGAYAADWRDFGLKFREYIKFANYVNNNDSTFEIKKLNRPRNLKIQWIFTRNTEQEIGKQFPILDWSIPEIQIDFPKDIESIKEIIKSRAEKTSCIFESDPLDFFANKIISIQNKPLGRILLGDGGRGAGLVGKIIQVSKRRYRQAPQETIELSKVKITIDDVNHVFNNNSSLYSDSIKHSNQSSTINIPDNIQQKFRHYISDLTELENILKDKSPLPNILATKFGIGGNNKTQGLQNKLKKFNNLLNSLTEDTIQELCPHVIKYMLAHHNLMILNEKNGFPEWMHEEARKFLNEKSKT